MMPVARGADEARDDALQQWNAAEPAPDGQAGKAWEGSAANRRAIIAWPG